MDKEHFLQVKAFDTYNQFRNEYKQYCKSSKTRYITAKSEKYYKESDPMRPYKMKYFKCAKHRSKNCKASFRLSLKGAGPHKNKYIITRFQPEHNHEPVFNTIESSPANADNIFKSLKPNSLIGPAFSEQTLQQLYILLKIAFIIFASENFA